MRKVWFALGVLLVLVVRTAFATDYSWTTDNATTSYSSAIQACTAAGSSAGGDGGSAAYNVSVNLSGGDWGYCGGKYTDKYSVEYTWQGPIVRRTGDSCPTNSTYNATTGACDATAKKDGEKCDDQTGARTSLDPMIWSAANNKCMLMTDADNAALCHYTATSNTTVTGYTVNGTVTNGLATAPPTFATDGFACELKTVSTTECTVNIKGVVTCQVNATFTGNVSTPEGAGSAVADAKDVCSNGAECIDTAAVTTHSDTGCATAGNCVQDESTDVSGDQKCGQVNGAWQCFNVAPTSSETKTTTGTTTSTASDGTVTSTVKTDKAITTCTDVAACTTKSSTSTATTVTDTNGNASTTSTCTGSCTGTGGSTGTGTDGDGDDDSNGTATTSKTCDSSPYCDGDAYSCAILKQEWIDSCAMRAGPTTDEQTAWDAKVTASKAVQEQAQTDLDTQVTGFVSSFESSATGTGGGKCFIDQEFSAKGMAFKLPFSEVCDALAYFRYALLLAAYLISARLVASEI